MTSLCSSSRWTTACLVVAVLLAGIGVGSSAPSAAAVEATFWSAPNPTQEVFWREMAQAFMRERPDIRIDVRAMVESPSSEATILTAIAGGTAPAGSENIFIGFGAQLYESGALVPLDTLPGWDQIIRARGMEEAIEGWRFPDGHFYILPIYSNAMLFGWRIDVLRELGYAEPPRTYSEVFAVGQRLRQARPRSFLMARAELLDPTWWQRWFDFFMLYYAASQGAPFVVGQDVTADREAAVGVFRFYQELNRRNLILTRTSTDPFPTGLSIWADIGPWTFPDWKERFPEMRLGETFALSPPPVPDGYPAGEPIRTFADAKGLVLYAQAPKEQRDAVWEFIRWVFTRPESDLRWLEATSLPPVRGDLATSPVFSGYLRQHPELVPYAEALPYAVPPFASPRVTDVQTALGEAGLVPAVRGTKTPEQAWEDARAAMEAVLRR
ncbi:MAG: extracellular solute-binding protein [Firmicutes bacterium]|nr:extracellular solute-binding protein [Bacillota bacterium]